MKLLQTYYTSCRVGQSGASGFQFYSFSEGLTNEELFEIEKIGNYIAPLNLPSNPSKEDIDSLFPVSFNYFKLKSGRVGVLQSVALIQDYSGRPGNFLSHAYILESGNFPFFPILLFKSRSFRTNLTSDEWNTTNVPFKLPPVELETLVKNSNINLSSIQDFLAENENEKIYTQIINSIIENSVSNRKIILSDNQINISFWLASISFSFPLNLANTLTFSTYSLDPANNNSLICATSQDGNRFNFTNDAAYQFQYYIFNIPVNKYSIVNHSSTYADVANTSLTISYDRFIKLHEFFNNFNYQLINNEIDLIYKIFAASEEKGQFQFEWSELLGFVSQYAKDTYLKDFLSTNIEYLEQVLSNIIDDNPSIIKFFGQSLSILKKTKSLNDFKINFDLYLSWLNMVVFCPDGENLSQVYLKKLLFSNELIVKQFILFGDYFETSYFNNENFNVLHNYLSDTETNSFSTYVLAITVQNSVLCNYDFENIFKLQSFNLIISQYSQNSKSGQNAELLFSSITDIKLYSILFDKLSTILSFDILISIAQKTDKNVIKPEVLLTLVKESGNAKLYIALMPYFLANVPNKSICFWNSIEFVNSKQITSQQYEYLIISYIKVSKPIKNETQKIIQLIIEKGCTNILPQIVEEYELTLSLENPKNEDYNEIAEMCSLKERYKIATKHNVCELSILLFELKQNKLPTVLSALKRVNSDLNIFPEIKFNAFASVYFRYLIPLISKEKDFYYIFLFITKITHEDTFLLFQNELTNNSVKSQNNDILIALVIFFFEIDQYKTELNSNWKLKIEQFIVDILVKQNNSSLENLDDTFRKKKNGNPKKWELLLTRVTEQRENKISNKINKLFGSIFKK